MILHLFKLYPTVPCTFLKYCYIHGIFKLEGGDHGGQCSENLLFKWKMKHIIGAQ